ncbi:MAG TPA: phosphate ABC transporter permease PstA [Mesorhizobium sp.]|jgi:phosphate transport system permease protein|nr:phosphate ABC transporter permease PstA [Mesorhizobium sp.]
MTDLAATRPAPGTAPARSSTDIVRARLAKRYRTERMFKWLGAAAVGIAALFLAILLGTIVSQALPALRANYAVLDLDLSPARVDPAKAAAANFDDIVNDALGEAFPSVTERRERRTLRGLISSGASTIVKRDALDGDLTLGGRLPVPILLDDEADLYLKGLTARGRERQTLPGLVAVSGAGDEVTLTFADNTIQAAADSVGARPDASGMRELGIRQGSVFVETRGGVVKLAQVGPGNTAKGEVMLPFSSADAPAPATLRTVAQPESTRKISDASIVYLDALESQGRIESRFNTQFLFGTASREPEVAGVWGAVVGSFLTLTVTLALAFPLGVAAAIYLEEFAPKNRLTYLIEVNINNLAAVPSIVFGLLGLAVFLNFFGMPRSAPVVGGVVLSLMTLPIIIIASRAALRAVPPSIREGAYGVGASKTQAVFHHVLPLAMPGIMTGTILGMAHALGETAPLLMIGMVAFIVDVPGGFTDPATILPVQIFMWADFPEAAFAQKTSAAILVLLVFLVLMNALAVLLRKRFERRW